MFEELKRIVVEALANMQAIAARPDNKNYGPPSTRWAPRSLPNALPRWVQFVRGPDVRVRDAAQFRFGRHATVPSWFTFWNEPGPYSGAGLREIRATHGVGRPPAQRLYHEERQRVVTVANADRFYRELSDVQRRGVLAVLRCRALRRDDRP